MAYGSMEITKGYYMLISKNSKVLNSFIAYCYKHPELRFWQALRNWSGFAFICASKVFPSGTDIMDTFYWEGKDG